MLGLLHFHGASRALLGLLQSGSRVVYQPVPMGNIYA